MMSFTRDRCGWPRKGSPLRIAGRLVVSWPRWLLHCLATLLLIASFGLPAAATEAERAAALRRYLLDDCFATLLSPDQPRRQPTATGAAAGNTEAKFELEAQTVGLTWIRRGLLSSNREWVALGWRIIDWGLAQPPERSADATHQTSRFLDSVALAMVLDPAGATEARRQAFALRLDWLASDQIFARASRSNRAFTHRTWMRASLFETAFLVLGDPSLRERAAANARQGLGQQMPDGAFPERGGFDVGYHVFGMVFQLQYLVAADPRDPLRAEVLVSLRRGLDWYVGRLSAEGIIDRTGSTRMLRESGGRKDVNYARAIEALLGSALVTGDRRWVEAAATMSEGGLADRRLPESFLQRFGRHRDGTLPTALVASCVAY